jgi:hypothetical protein
MDYVVADVKADRDAPRIIVPVPLLLAEAALSFVPDKDMHLSMDPGAVQLLPMAEAMVAELRTLPDVELVRVEEKDELVTITKKGDVLEVRVKSDRERVSVNVPLDSVTDVLRSAKDGRLDLHRALASLHRFGRTDLVEVQSKDEHVKIYVW